MYCRCSLFVRAGGYGVGQLWWAGYSGYEWAKLSFLKP